MPLFVSMLASLGYIVLAWLAWRDCRTPQGSKEESPIGRLLLLIPLLAHGFVLAEAIGRPQGVNFSIGNAVSLLVWLTVAVYWFAGLFYNLRGILVALLPFAAVAALLPGIFPGAHYLSHTDSFIFKAHFVIAFLAYSLLTIAALHAALVLLIGHRLHDHLPVRLSTPPVLTLERILFQILWAGFALLSLALLSGIVFAEEMFGQSVPITHKTVFAVASWVVFGALLGGRLIYGWRGRFAARWTLTGFGLLLLAYLGSKFVVEVLLGRG